MKVDIYQNIDWDILRPSPKNLTRFFGLSAEMYTSYFSQRFRVYTAPKHVLRASPEAELFFQ